MEFDRFNSNVSRWNLYLFNELQRVNKDCRLTKRIFELDQLSMKINNEYDVKNEKVPEDILKIWRHEYEVLGFLGYSLWQLKEYKNQAYDKELYQLSSAKGEDNIFRGYGFNFISASEFAKKGFDIEFMDTVDNKKTPDYFITKDNRKFACEATTRKPISIENKDLQEFWKQVFYAVDKKIKKFRSSEYEDGLLLIDCTAIAHLYNVKRINFDMMISFDPKTKITRERRVLHYENNEFVKGILELEDKLSKSKVCSVMFWYMNFEMTEENWHPSNQYRLLTLVKSKLWDNFEDAILITGKHLKIIYND